MTVRVEISHRTCYRYDRPVALSPHEIRLHPRPHVRIERYALDVSPASHRVTWYEDACGNRVAQAFFAVPTSELTLTVTLATSLARTNPFDFLVAQRAESFPPAYDEDEKRALGPYLELHPAGRAMHTWMRSVQALVRPAVTTTALLVDVNRVLAERIRYMARAEPGVRPCETTLDEATGSCRDSAWLLAQTLRRLGVATRFVSGYLVQLAREAADDRVDLHAWCEAYVPGAGWLGLDPTSGLLAAEGHLALAVAPAPGGAAAVDGYAEPGESQLVVAMHVARLAETGRSPAAQPAAERAAP